MKTNIEEREGEGKGTATVLEISRITAHNEGIKFRMTSYADIIYHVKLLMSLAGP